MKQFLKIWLIALVLPVLSVAQSQIKITVDLPADVVTKSQLKYALDSAFKTLQPNIPVIPGLADCKEGPIPVAVTKIKTTSAVVTFHGKDVETLAWKILQN